MSLGGSPAQKPDCCLVIYVIWEAGPTDRSVGHKSEACGELWFSLAHLDTAPALSPFSLYCGCYKGWDQGPSSEAAGVSFNQQVLRTFLVSGPVLGSWDISDLAFIQGALGVQYCDFKKYTYLVIQMTNRCFSYVVTFHPQFLAYSSQSPWNFLGGKNNGSICYYNICSLVLNCWKHFRAIKAKWMFIISPFPPQLGLCHEGDFWKAPEVGG